MSASRLPRVGVLLLGAVFAACDNPAPTEPVAEMAFAAAPGVKVNPPSNPRATAVSHSQINVTWQDNSSNETGFEVQRSTAGASGPFSDLAATGPSIVSYSDGTGAVSTNYCYRIRAFRSTGNKKTYSTFSSSACATTKPPPLSAAPSAVNAVPRLQGWRIAVTWTDNSTDETRFRVERSATGTGPWTAIGTTGPGVTSFEDEGTPVAEQPICYRVFAVNSFGDSGPSNVDCTTVPAGPTNLAATVLADGTVELTWGDNSAVEDGYQVERGGGGAEGITRIATLPANATSYRDVGLVDSSYGYMVRATKDGGPGRNSSFLQVVVATVRPNAPANVQAAPATSSEVNVFWVDQAMNEDGSRIERSTDGGTTWVGAGTVGWYLLSAWFVDYGPSAEQQVCYRVITFNRMGDSPPSNVACTAPPAGPSDFTANAVDFNVIDFSWTDNSRTEDGFQILIDYGYGYWETIASVGANVTSFRLEGFQPCCGFEAFYVTATRDGGTSDWSNPARP